MDINRKAELFDNALKGIEGLFPDEDLYEILRDVFGMTDDEIKKSGIQFADRGLQIADTPLGTISGVTPENGYSRSSCRT